MNHLVQTSRSSHQRYSIRKGALRNYTNFTGKHLCQSIFLYKVAGQRPAFLSKKRIWQMFSYEFYEISENTCFTEHLWTTASEHLYFSVYDKGCILLKWLCKLVKLCLSLWPGKWISQEEVSSKALDHEDCKC